MCDQCGNTHDEPLLSNEDLVERVKSWILIGRFYGYPRCCIDAFVERSIAITTAKSFEELERVVDVGPERKTYNMGYVPCKECAEYLGENDPQRVNDHLSTRVCSKPYPYGGNPKELEKYLKGLFEKEKSAI